MTLFSKIKPIYRIWILAMLAYLGSLGGGFVWLDHAEIVNAGYRAESAEEIGELFSMSLDSYLEKDQGLLDVGGGYWRPLHALSVSLDWELWGARPMFYHVENILWHLLVITGLYYLGLKILPAPSGPYAVFWGTLLFAVHPLGVHSVTWISGRKDILCAFFAILSLRILLEVGRAQRQPKTRHKGNPSLEKESSPIVALCWGLLMLFCASLSLMSKESGLIIPLLAIMVVFPAYKLRRRPLRFQSLLRVVAIASLCLCAAVYVFYRIQHLGGFGLNAKYPEALFLENVATFAQIACHNVMLVFFPWKPSISDAWLLSVPLDTMDFVVLVALAGGGLYLATLALQKRALVRPIFWYLIWMLPVAGLIPLNHLFAERYLYPASWGLLVAFCYGLQKGLGPKHQRVLSLFFSCATMYFATQLFISSLEWRDDRSLFEAAVSRDPNFVEGHIALGNLALDAEDFDQALLHYEQALEVLDNPGVYAFHSPFVLHTNAGLALHKMKQPQLAALQFMKAFEARPNNDLARYHLAMSANNLGDAQLAQKILSQLNSEGPKNHALNSNLAYSHLRSGDFSTTISILEPLLEERPTDSINRMNIASAYLASQRWDLATKHLLILAEQQPENAIVLAKLSWSLWMTGEQEAARLYLMQALVLDGQHPVVQHVKGIIRRP